MRGRMIARAVLAALLLQSSSAALAAPASSAAQPKAARATAMSGTARTAILPRGVALRTGDGDTRVVLQPGGPYGVFVFRDGARGEHIAVVYHGPMPTERDGAWALDDRFWQELSWSADANALVWSPDGTALYVSTGDHGSGGVFRLDLATRRALELWPGSKASTAEQGPGRSCEMMSADAARRLLRVRYQPSATQRPVAVDVRME